MKVYAIILNYKTYKETTSLVHQLLRQELVDLHIVVVDNCSPNESFQYLKQTFEHKINVEILQSEKNGGYSYGNNFGLYYIKKYNPELVFILNNDIIIDSNKILLNSLINEKNKNPNAVLCAPTMKINGIEQNSAWKIPNYKDCLIMATRIGQLFFKTPTQYIFQDKKKTELVECVAGSFFLANYPKMEAIGFFDEDLFLFGEETIIAQKIKNSGGINLLCRQFHYEHLWSISINNDINKIQRIKLQLYGREVFLKKYTKSSWGKIIILKILHKIRILEEQTRLLIHILFLKH